MSSSDAQFQSKNGFQTKVWGPPMWMVLHMIALNYSPEKKNGYKKFFNSLKYVLPCGACRDNYKKILKTKLPLDDYVFKCRQSMAMWSFLLHNQVQKDIYNKTNKEHDKPKYKDTKKDFYKAMQFYESFRAKCTKTSYGCVTPLKGTKKRSKIQIVKYSAPRKTDAILNKTQ